jgi:hypothetical protein
VVSAVSHVCRRGTQDTPTLSAATTAHTLVHELTSHMLMLTMLLLSYLLPHCMYMPALLLLQ